MLEHVVAATRPHLSNGEIQVLEELLTEYEDIFAMDSEDYGLANGVYHSIDTGDTQSIRQPPRRLPLAKQGEVGEILLDDMQRRGVIEESNSPWSSPVVLVRKNGDLRFCVDYRKINYVTRTHCFPLSQVDDTLDTLAGAKWFSTLDLKRRFWQVDLYPDDKEKTAFSTVQGLWEFMVTPFGLCNAPATFERLLETVSRGLTYESRLVYLGDVIVFGSTFPQHLLNLRKVLQRFREDRLKLRSYYLQMT
jgi:hypothetical protein